MTKEEIIQAITDDKMMPFIQPEQLAGIVDFVIKNYMPSLPSNLDEAAAFNNIWESEDCKNILDEGNSLTPRFKDLFKEVCHAFYEAGAEWMAGQRDSGIVTEAFIRTDGMGVPMIHFYDDEVKELIGDEVVVQIRKK